MIETLAIGDELLTGKTADTNSTFVSQVFFENGLQVRRHTVIADSESDMEKSILEISSRATLAICFGGLGPTSDDKTVDVVCRLLDCEPVMDLPSHEKLLVRYQERKRAVTTQALRQVRYPKKAKVIENDVGLAPIFYCTLKNCLFIFFPGVPSEMKSAFIKALPLIRENQKALDAKIKNHTWRCLGIWESDLQRLMDPVESKLSKDYWLGYRTVYPENHLTLYAKSANSQWDTLVEEIELILKPYCYSTQYDLESFLIQLLQSKNLSICFAESATGGLATHRLSQVPGASHVLFGGLVPYLKNAKAKLLGVHPGTEVLFFSAFSCRELIMLRKNCF